MTQLSTDQKDEAAEIGSPTSDGAVERHNIKERRRTQQPSQDASVFDRALLSETENICPMSDFSLITIPGIGGWTDDIGKDTLGDSESLLRVRHPSENESLPQTASDKGLSIDIPQSSSSKPCRSGGLGKWWKKWLDDNTRTIELTFDLHLHSGALVHHRETLKSSVEQLITTIDDLLDRDDSLRSQLGQVSRLRGAILGSLKALQEGDIEYEKVENELIQHEYTIQRRQARFIPQSGTNFDPRILFTSDRASTHAEDTRSRTSSNQIRADTSPDAINYLHMLGEVDLLKERLADLRAERRQLVTEQITREGVGLSLDEDSLEFLQTFDEQQNQLQHDLDTAQFELEQLRQLLPNKDDDVTYEEDSALGDSIAIQDTYNRQENDNTSNKPIQVRPAAPDFVQALFANDTDETRGFYDLIPESNAELIEPSEYVNAWLLYQLRRSPKELAEYGEQLIQRLPDYDDAHLEQVIFSHWFRDGSELDYARSKRTANRSLITNQRNSGMVVRSDSFLPSRSKILPLMKLNANTRANSIIARVRRYSTRSLRSFNLER